MDERTMRQQLEGSPAWNLVGVTIRSFSPTEAILEMVLGPQHLHSLGVVHGGLIATLIDCAAVAMVFPALQTEEYPLTVEFKVNFLSPGRGSRLEARARYLRQGRRVAVVAVHVVDDRGQDVAHGIVTQLIERGGSVGAMDNEHFAST